MTILRETASGQLVVREAVHQYLYTIANSYGADMPYEIPLWKKITVGLYVYLLAAGAMMIIKKGREEKKEK